jgi:hypothetical protein
MKQVCPAFQASELSSDYLIEHQWRNKNFTHEKALNKSTILKNPDFPMTYERIALNYGAFDLNATFPVAF